MQGHELFGIERDRIIDSRRKFDLASARAREGADEMRVVSQAALVEEGHEVFSSKVLCSPRGLRQFQAVVGSPFALQGFARARLFIAARSAHGGEGFHHRRGGSGGALSGGVLDTLDQLRVIALAHAGGGRGGGQHDDIDVGVGELFRLLLQFLDDLEQQREDVEAMLAEISLFEQQCQQELVRRESR